MPQKLPNPQKLSMAKKLVGIENSTVPIATLLPTDGQNQTSVLSGGNESQKSFLGSIKNWFQKKYWRQWLAISSGILAILLIALTLIFGWDQAWWRTSFDGKINLPVGQSSVVATVEFQNQTTNSNPDGSFSFKNVQFGQHEIRITSPNFQPLQKTVTVHRFGGFSYFTLSPVDFSSVQFQLLVDQNQPLLYDQLDIFIGKTKLQVNDSNIVLASSVPIDEEYLFIKSPFYADRKIPLNLRAGENLLPKITLQPAADIQLTAYNYLNNQEKLENVSITSGSQSITTNQDGQAVLTDVLLTNPSIKITANAQGFTLLETEIATNTHQQKIVMVPSGFVVFVTEKNGRRDIYKSHFNGENQLPVVQNFGNIQWFNRVDEKLLFQSDKETIANQNGDFLPQYFEVSTDGGTISRVSRWLSWWSQEDSWFSSTFFAQPKMQIIQKSLSNYSKMQLMITDGFGQNQKNIIEYEKPGYTLSPADIYLSNNGQKVAFNLQTSKNVGQSLPPQEHTHTLYTINSDGSNFTSFFSLPVSQGYPKILGFSGDSLTVFYTVWQGSTLSLIRHNLQDGSEQKFSDSLPVDSSFSIHNNDIYFASTRDQKTDIYRILSASSQVEKITDVGTATHFTVDTKNSILLFATPQGNFIRSLSAFNQTLPEPVATQISTNYTGWITINSNSMR